MTTLPDLGRDGGTWRWTWVAHGLEMAVRPLGHATDGRIEAEITVRLLDDDGAPARHAIAPTRIDLTGQGDRERLARTLAGRSLRRGVNWSLLVDQACALTIRGLREGVTAAPATFSAADLSRMDLPPVPEIVEGLLTPGVWILGGAPKSGKSWLMLHLMHAVAAGGYALGSLRAESGEALYLALEDTQRRLQGRLTKALAGEPAPAGLHMTTSWNRIDAGGLEELDAWLELHPATKVVTIDTLARARPRATGQGAGRLYDEDYDALRGLGEIAGRRGVAIVVVHHLRKGGSTDPLEALSGTMGLAGAADGILVLERRRSSPRATLHVIGRDLPGDRELALQWDDTIAAWTVHGDAADVAESETRRAILEVLREAGEEALSPKEIAEVTETSPGTVRQRLWQMLRQNLVRRAGYGKYTLSLTADAGFDSEDSDTRQNPQGDHVTRNTRNTRNSSGAEAPETVTVPPPRNTSRNSPEAGFTPPENGVTPVTPVTLNLESVTAEPGYPKREGPREPSVTTVTGVTGTAVSCRNCGAQTAADGVCWRCRDRPCRVCGEQTGSALRQVCVFCPDE